MDKDKRVVLINTGYVGYIDNMHGDFVYVKLVNQQNELTDNVVCTKKKNLKEAGKNVIPFNKFEGGTPFGGIKNI